VPVLQQIIDSRHFAELAAEEQLEPRGQQRADFRAAMIAATVYNCHRGKGDKTAKIKDFMPAWHEQIDEEDQAIKNKSAMMQVFGKWLQ